MDPLGHRDDLLSRIKGFIDANLDDPELSSSRIAKAHNISPRYLQLLFKADGTTVTDWVRRRRLEHCRRDLLDPRYARASIGAIAARWGFVDSAYFCRRFKSAYGIPPRRFRANGHGRYRGHTDMS